MTTPATPRRSSCQHRRLSPGIAPWRPPSRPVAGTDQFTSEITLTNRLTTESGNVHLTVERVVGEGSIHRQCSVKEAEEWLIGRRENLRRVITRFSRRGRSEWRDASRLDDAVFSCEAAARSLAAALVYESFQKILDIGAMTGTFWESALHDTDQDTDTDQG